MDFLALCVPEQVKAMRIWFQLGRTGSVRSVDVAIVHKAGGRVELRVMATPIVQNGRIVGFYCIAEYLTAHRPAEEARRESEARFAAFMRHSPSAAWMKDLQGRYVAANPETARIFTRPLNATLCTLMILKDQLKTIWSYRLVYWAARALERWCALSRTLGIMVLDQFAQMLEAHREGILAHCRWPIHTSKLEGVNNKIKVIKRVAYGFHDLRYFELQVKPAFA